MADPSSTIKLQELPITSINNNQQNSSNNTNHEQQQQQLILEQERFMPIANISRIMKRVLPSHAKLSKESKECIQECITEFFLFITSEAAEKCCTEKRKTITGEDLLAAMEELGFEDNLLVPLKLFMKRYKDANRSSTKDEGGSNEINATNDSRQNLTPTSLPSQTSKNHRQANTATKVTAVNNQHQFQQQQIQQPQQQQSPQEENDDEDVLQYLPSNFRRAKEIYVDTVTQQYYIFATLPDGTKGLLPVQLQPMVAEQ